MDFSDKYKHIGFSGLNVPDGWKPIVKRAIIDIEEEMWPFWIPLFIKRWIHYKATDNSVITINSNFWERVRTYLTGGQMITDIKDKFSELRIYGVFSKEIWDIVDNASEKCDRTCEICGSQNNVQIYNGGWVRRLCESCYPEK